MDLGKASLSKIFIRYAIPSVVGMVAMMMAFIVDGIFIGRYVGSHGLAAVNMVYPIISLVSGVTTMLAVGGSTLSNIRRGAKETQESNNIFTVTTLLLFGFGILASILVHLNADFVSSLLGANDEIMAHVGSYLSVVSYFFIAFALSIAFDFFIRAGGNPIFPIVAMIVGSILNVVFDYYFIVILQQGIEGAALATGLSQVVPVLLMFGFILWKSKWSFVIPIFKLKTIWEMAFNGSSEMVGRLSAGIVIFMFNWILMTRIGPEGVAAYSIAQYVTMIAMALFMGIAQSINAGISFNLGAKKMNRVLGLRNMALKTNLVLGIGVFVFLQFFSHKIIVLFANEDASLIYLAEEIVKYYSLAYLVMGANVIFSAYFTAINCPKESVLISTSRSLIWLVIGVLILPLFFGNIGIWLSVFFAELITLFTVFKILNKRNTM